MSLTVTTDRKEIYDTIRAWLGTYSGVTTEKVIMLNQAVSRPQKPYIGILILNRGKRLGEDDVIQSFDPDTQKVQRLYAGPRELYVQVECYTEPSTSADDSEAGERLENALFAVETEEVLDLFRDAKLAFIRQESDITNIDEQLGERWERRAQVDLVFMYSGEIFDDGETSGNWVETVGVHIADGEITTDSNFDDPTAWPDLGSGSVIADGKAIFNPVGADGHVGQVATEDLIVGKQYQVEFEISSISSGSIQARLGNADVGQVRTKTGQFSEVITCTDATGNLLKLIAPDGTVAACEYFKVSKLIQ